MKFKILWILIIIGVIASIIELTTSNEKQETESEVYSPHLDCKY